MFINRHFADDFNDIIDSKPISQSIILLNGSNASSLEVIPNDIINLEYNCSPIIVDLNWNVNQTYNPNEFVPQCLYNKYPPWIENEFILSINKDCIPIYHDENNVKCACKYFGSYSTTITQIFSINNYDKLYYDNISGFDEYSISTLVAIWILLIAFLTGCIPTCDKFDDSPMISHQVYLPKFSLFL